MKKIILSIILCVSLSLSVLAEDDKQLLTRGIKEYKAGNYLSTIQTMEKVVKNNPGSALAHYYIAISYVKVGNTAKAMEYYDKVIALNPNSQLSRYSELGKNQLAPQPESLPEIDAGLSPADNYTQDVEKELKQRNLQYLIDKVNRNRKIRPDEYEQFEKFPPKGSKPTSEEIAKAYETLARAGLNPYMQQQTPSLNPEMMQMNMLMGNSGNNNNMNNMLPFLMMNQSNGQKMDPAMMETMITNMMMPGMMNMYGNNNNDRY